MTADAVAIMLFDDVISRVSVPSAILTDRGGEFTAEVMECLYKWLGIAHHRTSGYHPQTDAKCKWLTSWCKISQGTAVWQSAILCHVTAPCVTTHRHSITHGPACPITLQCTTNIDTAHTMTSTSLSFRRSTSTIMCSGLPRAQNG